MKVQEHFSCVGAHSRWWRPLIVVVDVGIVVVVFVSVDFILLLSLLVSDCSLDSHHHDDQHP
jgi:hypothetical protein